MEDHSYYEELAALAAGGFLSHSELGNLRQHTALCGDCRRAESELTVLVRSQVPANISPFREFLDNLRTRPDKDRTARFLRRARREGIAVSPIAQYVHHRKAAGLRWIAAATALAAFFVATILYKTRDRERFIATQTPNQSGRVIDQLKAENTTLCQNVSRLDELISAQSREIEVLRKQAQSATGLADSYRNSSEQIRADADVGATRNAELANQIQDREKRMAEAQSQLEQLQEERNSEQASLIAQGQRISELSDELRIANADLALERQLASAGKDVRELMGARQLHVVDVRDSDPSGRANKPFGRVFLTEGKSFIFYAFDLNDSRVANAKHNFEVWGEQQGKKSSVRSLGFLYVDDKAQKRWALKVENPDLLSEIDSVFVTVEAAGHSKEPTGQRMLYAYLGEANHP
jgi:hypothetical protein